MLMVVWLMVLVVSAAVCVVNSWWVRRVAPVEYLRLVVLDAEMIDPCVVMAASRRLDRARSLFRVGV